MSDIAIRVENLSKRYRIGQRESYLALRDVLISALCSLPYAFSAPFHRLALRAKRKEQRALCPMPIYEYHCNRCGRRFSLLILRPGDLKDLKCRACGSRRLERLVSRVAILHSEEARLQSLADPARFADVDEQNPASVARWMKEMGKELGEDLGDEIDAALEAESEDRVAHEIHEPH